jgi:hypothetical protein
MQLQVQMSIFSEVYAATSTDEMSVVADWERSEMYNACMYVCMHICISLHTYMEV